MSLKQKNDVYAKLFGAAVAVLLALPVAAFVATFAGDTYSARSTAYILVLGWAIAGAAILLFLVRNSSAEVKKHQVLLWIVGVWLWPLLLLSHLKSKADNQ